MPSQDWWIVFRTKKEGSGDKDATQGMKALKGGINDVVQGLTGFNLAQLSVAGGLVLLANGVRKSVDAFVTAAGKTEDLMRLTGNTAEETSRLIGVAKILGITEESLAGILEFRAKRGLQTNIDTIKQLSEEYLQHNEGLDRSNFLLTQFGKTGTDVAELMEQGSKKIDDYAQSVHNVMTEKDIERAQTYARHLAAWKEEWDAVGTSIGRSVVDSILPSITAGEEQNQIIKDQEAELLALSTTYEGYLRAMAMHNDRQDAINKAEYEAIKTSANLAANYQAMGEAIQKANSQETTAVTVTADAHYKLEDAIYAVQDAEDGLTNAFFNSQDDLSGVTELFHRMTDEMLFNKAAEGLTKDQAYELAKSMGLIDATTEGANQKLEGLRKDLEDGKITLEEYNTAVANIKQGLDYLAEHPYTVDVYLQQHGSLDLPSTRGPGAKGFASGGSGSFYIPTGFPNDSFRLPDGNRAQTGERVDYTVTPAGGAPSATAGGLFAGATIIIKDEMSLARFKQMVVEALRR